jgi:hypothetical protein
MSASYAKAELEGKVRYTQELERLRQLRNLRIAEIVRNQTSGLSTAAAEYELEYRAAVASLDFDPFEAVPEGLVFDRVTGRMITVKALIRGHGPRIPLSPEMRRLMVSPKLVGAFDARSYEASLAPIIKNRDAALADLPLKDYLETPEFSNEMKKAVRKASRGTKLRAVDALPEEVAHAAVARFLREWKKADSADIGRKSALKRFGQISPSDFEEVAKLLQPEASRALKSVEGRVRKVLWASEDAINLNYYRLKEEVNEEFRRELEVAAQEYDSALQAAADQSPALVEGQTSLRGEFSLNVPPGKFVLYAQDTATDKKYRWRIPVDANEAVSRIELTDANALDNKEANTAMLSKAQLSGLVFAVTKGGDLWPARSARIAILPTFVYHAFEREGIPDQSDTNLAIKILDSFSDLLGGSDIIRQERDLMKIECVRDLLSLNRRLVRVMIKFVPFVISTQSDQEGRFGVNIESGDYTVVVFGRAGANAAMWITQFNSQEGKPVKIKMGNPRLSCLDVKGYALF